MAQGAGTAAGWRLRSPAVSTRQDLIANSGINSSDTRRQAVRSNEAPASLIALHGRRGGGCSRGGRRRKAAGAGAVAGAQAGAGGLFGWPARSSMRSALYLYHRKKLLGRRRGLASRVRAHEVPPAEGVFSPFLVLPQQPYDEKLHGGAINGCSGAPNACRPDDVYFAYTRCGRNRRCCRRRAGNSARSKREFQLRWAPCSRNMANPRATPGGEDPAVTAAAACNGHFAGGTASTC